MFPEPSGKSWYSGFHLIVARRHVISLVSCDPSCDYSLDFADVLMTLSLGLADLIMSFDVLQPLLNLSWLFQGCGLFNRPIFCRVIKLLQATCL